MFLLQLFDRSLVRRPAALLCSALLTTSILASGCSSDEPAGNHDGGGGGTGSLPGTSSGGSPGSHNGGTGGQDSPFVPDQVDWQLSASAPDKAKPTWPAIDSPIGRNQFWGALTGPLPTNTWWLGLTLEEGTGSIFPQPYQLRARSQGLQVTMPVVETQESYVFATPQQWVDLGTSGDCSRAVSAFDDLSVTMTWTCTGGEMSAPIVSGSPYITMFYSGVTPDLGLAVNGSGTRFEIAAGGSTWLVYAAPAITLKAGSATTPYTGSIRIAQAMSREAIATLDAHSGAIPRGGHVNFARQGKTGLVALSFDTEGAGAPLLLTLPHHRSLMTDFAAASVPLKVDTFLGPAEGIVSETWTLHYPLTDVGFRSPKPVPDSAKSEIVQALGDEADYAPEAQDSAYWSGKALSKLARLALIADEMGETSLRDTFLSRLEEKTSAWLDRENTGTSLVYDQTWGGVVNECVLGDLNCDFGQGLYNDHHFHYGYLVYAAAVLAKFDAQLSSGFVTAYEQKVNWLVRDYANPYSDDDAFTRLRHFDFYAGHSWTSGLISFESGRNQESTSEAVHAYYGLQLWGEATGNADLQNVGHILRIAESIGAQAYWQVKSGGIYQAPFANHSCVGIMWNQKVEYTTWFGTGDHDEHVCGIQMIPVTPATEDLLAADWVASRWDDSLGEIANSLSSENTWRDFFAAARTNANPAEGCAMIRSQIRHDDGNSRANMLHYCATR